jgi:NADH dehydrogenase
MKKIVILGAGYGGVIAALGLEKKFRGDENTSITLVDKHNYHLYAANLYEVATADEDFTTRDQLKKSISIPLEEILKNKKISFLQSEVSSIDQAKKTVQAGNKSLEYDQLVVALGSVSDYFAIEGAEKYSLPMKTFTDALKIRNAIEFAIEAHRTDTHKKNIRIVVAGGGYTGVEFAAELAHEIKILAWKNQYPPEKIEITVVEAMNQLIPGLSDRMSEDALWHLKNRGVRVQINTPIVSIDDHFITLQSGEKMDYDVLVWTTGVKCSPIPFTKPLNTDRKGRILTNQFLQFDTDASIFAIGDCACVLNTDGRPAPPTAQDAIEHGIYIADALPELMDNRRPAPYHGKHHGFIVTMGGRWAILNYGGFYFKGIFAYMGRVFAQLNYYYRVVGLWKAMKYILFDWEVYGRND